MIVVEAPIGVAEHEDVGARTTDQPVDFAWVMIITVSITTAIWLATTFLTSPEPESVLIAFYRRTRPSVTGWTPIARLAPDVKPARDGLSNLLCWFAGCALIYGVLFGVGKLLLHETGIGLALLAFAARSALLVSIAAKIIDSSDPPG